MENVTAPVPVLAPATNGQGSLDNYPARTIPPQVSDFESGETEESLDFSPDSTSGDGPILTRFPKRLREGGWIDYTNVNPKIPLPGGANVS